MLAYGERIGTSDRGCNPLRKIHFLRMSGRTRLYFRGNFWQLFLQVESHKKSPEGLSFIFVGLKLVHLRLIYGPFPRPSRDHYGRHYPVCIRFWLRFDRFFLKRTTSCVTIRPTFILLNLNKGTGYSWVSISFSNCWTVIIRQSPIVPISNKSLSPETK